MTNKDVKPIKLAIAAMGGQGGGVLSSWLVALAENNHYLAQYTSVPGVAQRTGATIYYLELFPRGLSDEAGIDPVMALMPTAGDVDIVIAGELVESGRAIVREFVTPENTVLIASTHRLYTQTEKQVMGDGRVDSELLIQAAEQYAKRFIGFDMDATALDQGCVISAVLFGALAGSAALPFSREQYEEVIRQGGKAVESNLLGFSAGFDQSTKLLAGGSVASEAASSPYELPTAHHPQVQSLLDMIADKLPKESHTFAAEGVRRLIDYQDVEYARQYLSRLDNIYQHDQQIGGAQFHFELSRQMARYLALWMSYEDTVRVADLKIRAQRFERYKTHVRAKSDDVAHVVEFMHPRVEEIADTLPKGLGNLILTVKPLKRFVQFFCKSRQVKTSRLSGFLLLYVTAGLRRLRRSSLRFDREIRRIDEWIELTNKTAADNYAGGVGVAKCQRLIKGYGDTLENGWDNYTAIINALPEILKSQQPGTTLATLRDAALADESGAALTAELLSQQLIHPQPVSQQSANLPRLAT